MTIDELAQAKMFDDQVFVDRLQAKVADLLRDQLHKIEAKCPEIPRVVLLGALIRFLASEIEETLSVQHGAALLRKIAAELEKTTAGVTVQ